MISPHHRLFHWLAGLGRDRHRRVGGDGIQFSIFALIFAGILLDLPAQPVTNSSVVQPSAEFAIETWRTDNGLPQNTVTAVFQTRRGYIWAGTYNGLVEFDGVRFKVFDSSSTKGLVNSRVTSLYEDSQGDIWIGHDTGEVTRHTGNKFLPVKLAASWGHAPIKDFLADERGELWVLNQLGEALRLKDQLIHTPPAPMQTEPFANPRVTMDGRKRAYVVRHGVVARCSADGVWTGNALTAARKNQPAQQVGWTYSRTAGLSRQIAAAREGDEE